MIDLGLLRQVALTAFDVNTIKVLMKTGGEALWNASIVKPETKAMIQLMIDKKLIEMVERPLEPTKIRLTDIGRSAAAQIEASMQAAQRTAPVAG